MNEIRRTAKLVEATLLVLPHTRDSDDVLYHEICKNVLESQGKSINECTLTQALMCRKTLGLPKYETVRRARQKLQAKHPELASSERVAVKRDVREKMFRDYAREG